MTDLLKRLRYLLQDLNSEIWNDDELTALLNEGQSEYAERTGCLTASFELLTVGGGGEYPRDFVDFIHGINSDENDIVPATWERIQEIAGDAFIDEIAGVPVCIYENLSDYGSFEVYPVPDQAVSEATDDSPWGLATIAGGTEIWGRLEVDGYEQAGIWGITAGLTNFTKAGKIYYSRRPVEDALEVGDTLALIYYAGAKAFETETERQNLKMAEALQEIFDGRVDSFARSAGVKIQYNYNIGSWF